MNTNKRHIQSFQSARGQDSRYNNFLMVLLIYLLLLLPLPLLLLLLQASGTTPQTVKGKTIGESKLRLSIRTNETENTSGDRGRHGWAARASEQRARRAKVSEIRQSGPAEFTVHVQLTLMVRCGRQEERVRRFISPRGTKRVQVESTFIEEGGWDGRA